ncbi:MAG TPA: FAD:protein FMN transferase [Candidatus Hydrogenedens sp.]|nr:FAD:protein FMN transferase [Candidatus Hydrogenedens sp.]
MLLCLSSVLYGEATKSVTLRFSSMGTEFAFIIYPPTDGMLEEDIRNLCEPAIEAIHRLEKHISHYFPDNDLARLNQSAGLGAVKVNGDLFEVIRWSKLYWEQTDGAFDPTVGPLLDLWGFSQKNRDALPSKEEIAEALKKVGMDKVKVNEENQTVELTVPGMRLNFGGIGKGLALDRAARILKEQGIKSAVLHAGTSSIIALDPPPNQTGWKIGIRSPYNKSEQIEEFEICNESLSTSSVSEQYLERNGKKYGHIFNPKTGLPVDNNIVSSTVITKSATESDALSTSFFVMGIDKTKKYCNKFQNLKVFLVSESNNKLDKLYINLKQSED